MAVTSRLWLSWGLLQAGTGHGTPQVTAWVTSQGGGLEQQVVGLCRWYSHHGASNLPNEGTTQKSDGWGEGGGAATSASRVPTPGTANVRGLCSGARPAGLGAGVQRSRLAGGRGRPWPGPAPCRASLQTRLRLGDPDLLLEIYSQLSPEAQRAAGSGRRHTTSLRGSHVGTAPSQQPPGWEGAGGAGRSGPLTSSLHME